MDVECIRLELTNYCNLKCPYCFFCDLRSDNIRDEMSLSDFKEILEYARDSGLRTVFLQGGEPLVHSGIVKILRFLRKRGYEIVAFTNALFDHRLLKELKAVGIGGFLINYNHPETYGSSRTLDLVKKNIRGLRQLNLPMKLGYTLYEKTPRYQYFLNGIKEFKARRVRWDIARPSGGMNNKYIGMQDVLAYSGTVARFLKDCLSSGALPQYDCPLPLCFTLKGDFNFMRKYLFIPESLCNTVLNIGPGLRLSTCPASVQTKDISLRHFMNLGLALEFIRKMEDDLRWRVPTFKECGRCFYWHNRLCQGGCIGYKRERDNKVLGRDDLKDFLKRSGENIRNRAVKNIVLKKRNKSAFELFRIGVALAYARRLQEAVSVFMMIDKRRLVREEQKYIDSFLVSFLHGQAKDKSRIWKRQYT